MEIKSNNNKNNNIGVKVEKDKIVSMKSAVDFVEKNAGLFDKYFDAITDIKYGYVPKPAIRICDALADYLLKDDVYAYGALGEFAFLHRNEECNEANAYGLILRLIEEEEFHKGLKNAKPEEIQEDGNLAKKKIEFEEHKEMYRKLLYLCEDRRDLNMNVGIKAR